MTMVDYHGRRIRGVRDHATDRGGGEGKVGWDAVECYTWTCLPYRVLVGGENPSIELAGNR